MGAVEVLLLGPVEARRAGRALELGGPLPRALLSVLALRAPAVVPVEALIDALWPDGPPASAAKVVQTYVSRLRKALGEETIERRGGGYALRVPPTSVDLNSFEQLAQAGRTKEALALWRGPALADLARLPGLRAEAERLEELRLRALEERIGAELQEGAGAELVAELQALVAAQPLRERLRGLLMLALYRGGRQADALELYRETRRVLAEELGIDPSPDLQALERAILNQEPMLSPAAPTARAALPSGTVTFLFADVEGSTRLLHDLGPEAYGEALAEFRRAMREAATGRNGAEVDTQGDAIFFAFARATEAVAAASVARDALSDDGRVRARIGLHTGEPVVTAEGYVGIDVHRASRICAAGHGGQILLAETTRRLVEDEVRDLGEHRLRDLSAPERIYQLGDEEFPPLKSLYRANLPAVATPFVGRERELAAVTELLARDDLRLLTLTGPGGSGKTRLALQAAAEAADVYPDGVFWVPLAALRDAALVREQLAAALGIKGDLADQIADKRILAVLDNFEHLIEAADDLNHLLGSCPNLHLLVTSRALLRLPHEQAYPVPSLAPRDGVELFVARVRALDPAFEQTRAVAALCRALENLPLALELAAARAVALSPEQLLERLSTRLDLLRVGHGVDPRHRTLRATIEWSHELLDDPERQLFRRLSVFAGGFRLDAAEEVCDSDLDVLQALVEKSLVRHAHERFSMLETIREYAAEKLAESGDEEHTRLAHAMHFASLAERAALDEPTREPQAAWLDRLTAEHENLRAALDFSDVRGLVDVELRVVQALRSFWFLRGFWSEGRAYLERALDRAEAKPAEIRVDLLNETGQLAERQGDYERARALDREHLSLARELGDERKLANALMRAAIGAEYQGDFDLARTHLREVLAISTRSGDSWSAARARLNLGYSYLAENDFAHAEDQLEQAIGLARTLGNKGLLSACLHAQAIDYLKRDLAEAALPQMKEAALLAIEIRSPEHIAGAFAVLAAGLAARGKGEQGARLLGAAKAIHEQLALVEFEVIRQQSESTASMLCDRLGVARFEAASADGAEMGLERAIEFALQTIDGVRT